MQCNTRMLLKRLNVLTVHVARNINLPCNTPAPLYIAVQMLQFVVIPDGFETLENSVVTRPVFYRANARPESSLFGQPDSLDIGPVFARAPGARLAHLFGRPAHVRASRREKRRPGHGLALWRRGGPPFENGDGAKAYDPGRSKF